MNTSCFMHSAKIKKYDGKPEKIPGLFSHNRFANVCRRVDAVVVERCGRNFRADLRFIPFGVEGLHFIKGRNKGRKKTAVPAAPDSCVSFCPDNPPAAAPHIGSQPPTGRMAAKVDGSNRCVPLGCEPFLRAARYFYERIVDSDPRPFCFCSPPFDARRDNRAGQTFNRSFRNRRFRSALWDLSGHWSLQRHMDFPTSPMGLL